MNKFYRTLNILLLFLTLPLYVSCQQEEEDDLFKNPTNPNTDVELEYYTNKFYDNAKSYGNNPPYIPVNFKDLSDLKMSLSRSSRSSDKEMKVIFFAKDGKEYGSLNELEVANSSYIGACYYYVENGRNIGVEIFIDDEYWLTADEYKRFSLIDHELGHCAYGRNHDNEAYRGHSTSVMWPTETNPNRHELFYDAFQDELHENNKESVYDAIDKYVMDNPNPLS